MPKKLFFITGFMNHYTMISFVFLFFNGHGKLKLKEYLKVTLGKTSGTHFHLFLTGLYLN